jgi:uncharacterized membrane protein
LYLNLYSYWMFKVQLNLGCCVLSDLKGSKKVKSQQNCQINWVNTWSKKVYYISRIRGFKMQYFQV